MLESFLQKRKKSSAPDIGNYEQTFTKKRKSPENRSKSPGTVNTRVSQELKGILFTYKLTARL
jgi:hypothetical protein